MTTTTTTSRTVAALDVLRAVAYCSRAVDVIRDACDLIPAAPDVLVSRIAQALDTADDGIAGARAVRDMFDRVSHQTRTTAEPTDDTATFVRRVVLDVAAMLDSEHRSLETARDRHVAAGDGGIVYDPLNRRWQHVVTRPAARRERSRSGRTSPVADRSRLDNAERLAVVRADESSRLTGIPLLGRIDGRTPREVTPRLGGIVTGVTVTDANGADVTAHYAHGIERGADAIGRTLRSHEVIRLADRPRHRNHREDWDADGTRYVWQSAGIAANGAPYWRLTTMRASVAVMTHAVREQSHRGAQVLDVDRDADGRMTARRWVTPRTDAGAVIRSRVWRHYVVRGFGPRAIVRTAAQRRADDSRVSHVARDAQRAAVAVIRDQYATALDALDVDRAAVVAGRLVTRVGTSTRGAGRYVLDVMVGASAADGIDRRATLRALVTA